MKTKYKCLYEITGRIEDVATFLVPIADLPQQRTWVGLTEKELQKILQEVSGQGWKPMLEAIEAKLKEKNTCNQ